MLWKHLSPDSFYLNMATRGPLRRRGLSYVLLDRAGLKPGFSIPALLTFGAGGTPYTVGLHFLFLPLDGSSSLLPGLQTLSNVP
jgi:hypothetical protein